MGTFLKFIIICLALILMPIFYEREQVINFLLALIILSILIFNLIIKLKKFFNGRYYYDNNNMNYYNSYQENFKLPISPKKYIYKKTKHINIYKDIENKCKINSNRLEIVKDFKTFDDYKITQKLLECKPLECNSLIPIKEIVAINLEKKEDENLLVISNKPRLSIKLNDSNKENNTSSNVISIINDNNIDNNRKGVYETIINLFNEKKYSTSKCCRLLKAIRYIDLTEISINIYINNKELESYDTLPMTEIRNALRKALHCEQLQVLFFNAKHINIFDYYLEYKMTKYNEK